MKDQTRYLAVAMIFVGAALILNSTAAFSTVESDRGASVTVPNDVDAYLSIQGTDAANTPTFTNLFNQQIQLTLDTDEPTAEFDPGDSGSWVDPPYTTTLNPGQELELGIRADTEEITIDMDGSMDGGAVQLSREFEVPQTAGLQDVEGSVQSAGNSGQYEFQLENTGGIDVEIDGIGVNWADDPDAAQVGGRGNDDVVVAEGTQVVDQVVEFDSSEPNSATVYDFSQTVALNPNQEVDFEFDRFREAGGGPGSGVGVGDVDITIRAADGSTAVVELRE